jgi:DNA-binding MarR family transcriptional regulator
MVRNVALPEPPLGIAKWPTFGLGQLYRGAHTQLEARLGVEGQSLRTYYVLVALAEFGSLSQQDVCDRIAVDRSDMVRLVDDLETRGQVKRTRDARDRRRHQLTLTAQGRRARARCDAILAEVTAEVFSALAPDERRTLHRLTLRALRQAEEIAILLDAPTNA